MTFPPGNRSLLACTQPPEFNPALPSLCSSITGLFSTNPSVVHPLCAYTRRPVHGNDGSLLPEEEDRILRHPDLHAVLHDRHSVTGLLLAQSGVRTGQDRVR